jgi:hypothetical protein
MLASEPAHVADRKTEVFAMQEEEELEKGYAKLRAEFTKLCERGMGAGDKSAFLAHLDYYAWLADRPRPSALCARRASHA